MRVLEQIKGHSREERRHRAMAHFRMALNYLNPENRVLSAQSLWIVVENLTHVVFDRLCGERRIDPQAHDAKHRLALKMGYEPKKSDEPNPPELQALIDSRQFDPKRLKRDNTHLDALDTYIRREILLGGDKACYKQLQTLNR